MILYILVAVLTAAIVLEFVLRRKADKEHFLEITKDYLGEISMVCEALREERARTNKLETELADIKALLEDVDLKELIDQQKAVLDQSEMVMDGISNILSYQGPSAARKKASK